MISSKNRHPFWDIFNARKPKRQKKLGHCQIENIDNWCYITLAVNPKQYFEFFSDDSVNKKHKGIKKGSGGMEYSNNANRITSLVNFNRFEKPRSEYKEVERFVVKQGDMVKTTVTKTKFLQLNEKRFYFPNGILSLPYGHPSLEALDNFQKEQGQKIEKYFWEKKKSS